MLVSDWHRTLQRESADKSACRTTLTAALVRAAAEDKASKAWFRRMPWGQRPYAVNPTELQGARRAKILRAAEPGLDVPPGDVPRAGIWEQQGANARRKDARGAYLVIRPGTRPRGLDVMAANGHGKWRPIAYATRLSRRRALRLAESWHDAVAVPLRQITEWMS